MIIGLLIASLVVAYPIMSLYVKRLHDLDMSGWFLISFFVAAAIAIVLGFGLRNAGVVLLGFVGLVGFVPGRRGDNRFGPDPIVPQGESLSSNP